MDDVGVAGYDSWRNGCSSIRNRPDIFLFFLNATNVGVAFHTGRKAISEEDKKWRQSHGRRVTVVHV